jgi:hypothetical protein
LWVLTGVPAVLGQVHKASIVFDTTATDLGTVLQGETVRKVFTYRNAGSAPLEIADIRTS